MNWLLTSELPAWVLRYYNVPTTVPLGALGPTLVFNAAGLWVSRPAIPRDRLEVVIVGCAARNSWAWYPLGWGRFVWGWGTLGWDEAVNILELGS